jgi:hypothetical protein
MCRVNNQTANYRQNSLDTDIHIIDKHKLQASFDGRKERKVIIIIIIIIIIINFIDSVKIFSLRVKK